MTMQDGKRFAGSGDGAAMSKNERIKETNARIRRQKQKRNIVVILVALIGIVALLFVLSVTVFFRIDEISVEGSARYTDEQIIEAGGLKTGDRMLLLHADAVSEKIMQTLFYVDGVSVEKKFPGTVRLVVTDASPTYAVRTDNGFVLFSAGGRVLESGGRTLPEACTVVSGLGGVNMTPGARICNADNERYQVFTALTQACAKGGLTGLTYINLDDIYGIYVIYENRITLKLGGISNMDDKALAAAEVLKSENQSNPNRSAVIDLTDDLKAYVRGAEHMTLPYTEIAAQTTLPTDVAPETDDDDYDEDDDARYDDADDAESDDADGAADAPDADG